MGLAAVVTAAFTAINLGIAIWNVLYSQGRSDRREVEKWRSDRMLQLTSELLQLSTERQSAIEQFIGELEGVFRIRDRPTDSAQKVWDMELLVEQTRLLSDYVGGKAEAVYKAHKEREDAWAAADDFEADLLTEMETLVVDHKALEKLHKSLVTAFRVYTHVDR
jgi:hypothetical protein